MNIYKVGQLVNNGRNIFILINKYNDVIITVNSCKLCLWDTIKYCRQHNYATIEYKINSDTFIYIIHDKEICNVFTIDYDPRPYNTIPTLFNLIKARFAELYSHGKITSL